MLDARPPALPPTASFCPSRYLGDSVAGPQFTDMAANTKLACDFFTKDLARAVQKQYEPEALGREGEAERQQQEDVDEEQVEE